MPIDNVWRCRVKDEAGYYFSIALDKCQANIITVKCYSESPYMSGMLKRRLCRFLRETLNFFAWNQDNFQCPNCPLK